MNGLHVYVQHATAEFISCLRLISIVNPHQQVVRSKGSFSASFFHFSNIPLEFTRYLFVVILQENGVI